MKKHASLLSRSRFVYLVFAAACACLLTSCYTTSISNPGSGYGSSGGGNAFYRGELEGLDVLGIPDGEVSESAIRSALGRSTGRSVRIPRGSRVLLVQSGAIHPDAALQKAVGRHFQVVPFSGVAAKDRKRASPSSESKRLRLAAAKAGVRHIIVVWGSLETATGDLPTRAVSWVPVAGMLVADEQKATRIITTAAVIETATGAWRSISSDPIVRSSYSAEVSRTANWARQVESLKAQAYPDLASKVAAL